MPHWFDDFKWLDIVLNMIALAIVPFLYALVGGNLAVEGIADQKRRRRLKGFFWGLFVIGILVIAIQQFTAARAAIPPDLKLTFSVPKNPAALASLVKSSVAKTVNTGAVLWDLDAFNGHSLNLQSFTAEYVKENQPSGPVQLLTQNAIGNPVNPAIEFLALFLSLVLIASHSMLIGYTSDSKKMVDGMQSFHRDNLHN